MLDKTYYLPKEQLTYTNYPEVRDNEAEIQQLLGYASEVDSMLYSYNNGLKDKINLNRLQLNEHIAQCRRVLEKLGNAENVCFDVVIPLRELQNQMQLLAYLARQYGDAYIGEPSETTEDVI